MTLTPDQQNELNELNASLLTNLDNKDRVLAEKLVARYPFLYIKDRAFDVCGQLVEGYFALHTKDLDRDMGDVFTYFTQLEAEGNPQTEAARGE